MKIRLLNGLLLIDILTVLLVLGILLVPTSAIRIVLGLPFLLFFPGYVLVAALFPLKKRENGEDDSTRDKAGMGGFERIALSFGMSIAVTALIGLGLNYTPWGIRLYPVMYSNAAFIIVMSIIAVIRLNRLPAGFKATQEFLIKMPGWEGSVLNKALTLILAISIVGTIGVLGYTVTNPKIGERFTEFYILGNNGMAEKYPTSFTMVQGKVTQVSYDKGVTTVATNEGKVTLGIVNQEQQETTYTVALQIDGQDTVISFNGTNFGRLEQIKLQQAEKWEQEIGFSPLRPGYNQRAELFLYKDGSATAEETLHIWVDVKGE